MSVVLDTNLTTRRFATRRRTTMAHHEPTLLRSYIDANASLPPDCVLGNLAWFTVEDRNYPESLVHDGFDQFGLNPRFLPTPINPLDAFEKATTDVAGSRYNVTMANGTLAIAEIMVREVSRADDTVVRHLIREVRDAANRRLDYAKVGEFTYYRPAKNPLTGRVDLSTARVRSTLEYNLPAVEQGLLSQLIARFDEAYYQRRTYLDGPKIRKILRDYFLYLNAVQMKPSVYFVHANRSPELERLRSFTETIDGASISLWQLPDLPHLREEVIDTFQREAEKSLTEVVKSIQTLRATRRGKISAAAYMKVREEYDAIMGMAGEYTRVLRVSQDRTGAAAEVALDALIALQEDVYKTMEEEA